MPKFHSACSHIDTHSEPPMVRPRIKIQPSSEREIKTAKPNSKCTNAKPTLVTQPASLGFRVLSSRAGYRMPRNTISSEIGAKTTAPKKLIQPYSFNSKSESSSTGSHSIRLVRIQQNTRKINVHLTANFQLILLQPNSPKYETNVSSVCVSRRFFCTLSIKNNVLTTMESCTSQYPASEPSGRFSLPIIPRAMTNISAKSTIVRNIMPTNTNSKPHASRWVNRGGI